ncbi:MAG: hypothetical protein RR197_05630, partial [Oscillospiraceae bacterium]
EIHVIRPFAIPAHRRRTVALDYGLDMLAALWIAVDESGRGVVYRELCSGKDGDFFNKGGAKLAGTKPLLVTEAAREIRENTPAGEKIFNRVGPPDLWNRHQDTGESTADLFAREGMPLTKASNERAQGWMALAEWLKIGTDEQGKPSAGLRIFENCRVLIASLPQLQYSDRDADDCASEPHAITHAPDALRYFVAGRPIPSGAAPKEDPFAPEEDEIESFLNFGR